MAGLHVGLWTQAFSYLGAQEVLKASISSKHLHGVIKDDGLWCYLACRRWPQVELYSSEELHSAIADVPVSATFGNYRSLYKHLATNPLQSRHFQTFDTPRIYCFFAADAPIAVVLVRLAIRGQASGSWKERCGLWEMVRWSLADNTFQRGQFVRLIIRPEMCCLSPDGENFVYVGGKYRSHFARSIGGNLAHGDLNCNVYMVLSRPPYFSAVALWQPNDMLYDGSHHNGSFDLQNTSCGCASWDSRTSLKIGLYNMPPTRGYVPAVIHVSPNRRDTVALLEVERAAYTITAERWLEFDLPRNEGVWCHPQFRPDEVFYARQGKLFAAQLVEQGRVKHLELLNFTDDEFVQLSPPEWAKHWGFEGEGTRP